jgi:hypothetical protein
MHGFCDGIKRARSIEFQIMRSKGGQRVRGAENRSFVRITRKVPFAQSDYQHTTVASIRELPQMQVADRTS